MTCTCAFRHDGRAGPPCNQCLYEEILGLHDRLDAIASATEAGTATDREAGMAEGEGAVPKGDAQ